MFGFIFIGDIFCFDYIYLCIGEMYFVVVEVLYRVGKENEVKIMLIMIMKICNLKYEIFVISDVFL